MARFRKKPVEIEAFRWWPYRWVIKGERPSWWDEDRDSIRMILKISPQGDMLPTHIYVRVLDSSFTERTMVEAGAGDWIVRGIEGELYPCKDRIFRKLYDPIDDAACTMLKDNEGR